MFTFVPTTKKINIDSGVVSFNAADLYAAWKEWMLQGNNLKHPIALVTVGGETVGPGQTVSPYFFVVNGWEIKPQEADHTLIVTGNLLKDGGGSPFIPTTGDFVVSIITNFSSNSLTVATGGGGGATAADIWSYSSRSLTSGGVSAIQSGLSTEANATANKNELLVAIGDGGASPAEIADAVWDEARSGHNTAGTFGETNQSSVTADIDNNSVAEAVWNYNFVRQWNQSAIGGLFVKIFGLFKSR